LKNNNPYSIDEAFLARYFAGETSASEEILVETWLSQSEENRHFYESLKMLWNAANSVKQNKEIDTDIAWLQLKAKMKQLPPPENIETKVISLSERKKKFNWFSLGIAASVALLLGLGLYFFESQSSKSVFATQNFTASVKLPDGSSVFLNRNSRLTYPATFSGKTREVILEGEGFFEVKRNEKQPFIIHTGDVDVKVLGTSFNVKTNKAQETEVIVKTGKVLVTAKKDTAVLLPNQRVMYAKAKLQKTTNKDQNFLSYKTGSFIFENTPIEEVVAKLNEVFQVNIVIEKEDMKRCQLTQTAPVEDKLDIIINDLLVENYGFGIQKEGNKIILKGGHCQPEVKTEDL
jgi:ferric-dicitrate binding protein FerR (iron transport regulator)